MWKLPGWIRGDCKVILLLIGAKIILSQVELALALMIEEGASRKKHCMLCILFAFGALTELAMLAGWIRVLFPAVYERKEDIHPILIAGIGILGFAVFLVLRCWSWEKFLRKTFMGEDSGD
ncbi:hypothetical protein [uncultured Acetatifactor sp.]|jgi:uncharacterized membrane protein YedE/YeeE|uniref:hypothetical protein n=1 Tax=uncultured Acetatifactor sp. TaxID=1671927 RepID=UPI00260C87A6|nr:hypothetical protein [uncultured Acetatifactor sp.]